MIKLKQNTLLIVLPTICLSTIIISYFHHQPAGQSQIKTFPDEINQISTYPNISEEISSDGKYVRKYFAWVGQSWPSTLVNTSVCLATQGSPNYLHWVELHARLWKGPISVGVYAPGLNFMVAYNRIKYLRKCYPAVRDIVSFHIVFPIELPPLFLDEEVIDVDCRSDSVETVFETVLKANLSSITMHNYPQNHLRNTARTACPTTFALIADIDMIPWDGMSSQMNVYFSDNEYQNCAYVVPIYEIHSRVEKFPPSGKEELLSLLAENNARIFHSTIFKPNQMNSDLQTWEKKNSTSETKIGISYRIKKYKEYWEPILVLPSSAPAFFERFIGYGFTRNSHVYFLNFLHFHFNMLDKAFLSHSGFQEKTFYSKERKKELAKNTKLYVKFKKEMMRKYEI